LLFVKLAVDTYCFSKNLKLAGRSIDRGASIPPSSLGKAKCVRGGVWWRLSWSSLIYIGSGTPESAKSAQKVGWSDLLVPAWGFT